MTDEVPLIDVSSIFTKTGAGVREVADQIARACEDIGFFYVVGHSVPQDVMDGAFDAAARFFEQPVDKLKEIKVNPWHRGYMPMHETTMPGFRPDVKDSFDWGPEYGPDDEEMRAGKPLHGPNQWPDLPGFREAVGAYYAAVKDFGFALLEPLAVSLDLEPDFFQKRYERKPFVTGRLIHYPPFLGEADPETFGAAVHTDYGVLTLLAQDDVGGLQIQNRAGKWIDAPSIKGSFVVNIGDMMACWTNDRFTSTPHRVLNTTRRHRFSIPVFYSPHFDTVAECLPSCQSPENPPKYAPITWGAYLNSRFNERYAYRKTAKSA